MRLSYHLARVSAIMEGMKQGFGITGTGAFILALSLLGVFLVVFALSHQCWYDHMRPEDQVKFWTDFGVAYGTIALALVTGASVFETQRVVKGEDRRFRQSRIPTVAVIADNTYFYRVTEHEPQVQMLFSNIGDGPAVDVTITMDATVKYVMAAQPLGAEEQSCGTEPMKMDRKFLVSFLPKKGQHQLTHPLKYKQPEFRVDYPRGINFRSLRIDFKDTFGYSYVVNYPDFNKNPNYFERDVPKDLQ